MGKYVIGCWQTLPESYGLSLLCLGSTSEPFSIPSVRQLWPTNWCWHTPEDTYWALIGVTWYKDTRANYKWRRINNKWTEGGNHLIKKINTWALAGVVQWLDCHPGVDWKVVGSIPSEGTHPSCGFDPQWGRIRVGNRSMFLSPIDVSLSFPFSLPLFLRVLKKCPQVTVKKMKWKAITIIQVCAVNSWLGFSLNS